jgi:hypothetical protein
MICETIVHSDNIYHSAQTATEIYLVKYYTLLAEYDVVRIVLILQSRFLL